MKTSQKAIKALLNASVKFNAWARANPKTATAVVIGLGIIENRLIHKYCFKKTYAKHRKVMNIMGVVFAVGNGARAYHILTKPEFTLKFEPIEVPTYELKWKKEA